MNYESNFDKNEACVLTFRQDKNILKIESETNGHRSVCGQSQGFLGHEFLKI